ncbi:MAG: tRNA (adenosine(37)-N6)-threonylcarbamoyltransferase complex ATPase subunit type 1 TsaE [Vicinamibacterales bacterium]
MITESEAETVAAGRNLAVTLQPGDVVLLSGALGAGKTVFVRGLAEGLGANSADVTSPTFTLIQEYRGPRITLYHVDLYRLEPKEVDDLGLEELLSQEGIVALEWPERLPRPITGAIEVLILDNGDARREIRVTKAPPPED